MFLYVLLCFFIEENKEKQEKKKKRNYANLNHYITDTKKFWKTVKPLLSDKFKSSEKVTLVEDEKITNQDESNIEFQNLFFSNAVKNLKIPKFSDINPQAHITSLSIFKAILKYENYRSILAIKSLKNDLFYLKLELKLYATCNEIKQLNPRKATQSTDIPVGVLKENPDIFSSYICDFVNETVKSGKFSLILKHANITLG